MPSGWKGSKRRTTLPPDWAVIQLRILRRDYYRCQHVRYDTGRRCLKAAREVDHIVSAEAGGTDDDANLQALCSWHHGQKSGKEGGIASGKARRAKRDAAKPIHPGLMDPVDQQFTASNTDDEGPFPF
jgi:5-methylcytosine-specific restriction endonuclease McrA